MGDQEVVGRAVTCTVCGLRKAPRGRSVPAELTLCDHECPGWSKPPNPGDLWPGETASEFGYPCEGPSDESEFNIDVRLPDLDRQIQCVIREIAMRDRVYPNWIRQKRMTEAKAQDELSAMQAVLKTLQTLRKLLDR